MFGSLIILGILLLIVTLLYHNATSIWGIMGATLVIVALFYFVATKMEWVFVNISRDYNIEEQKCIGWSVKENKCVGAVTSRY